MNSYVLPSSFRDPSGFVFVRDKVVMRQININSGKDYDYLMKSGLYRELIREGLLIPHEEIEDSKGISADAYKIIQPEQIQFISYPYEWCFSQLKAAALATITIQKKALEFGMSLKDCSSYNIQFRQGRPVMIDTLSFERYQDGQPWAGYRQFCQHFLGPLALMSLKDVRLSQFLRIHIDGIPLDLTSNLLPFRSFISIPLLLHIHLHAKSQDHFANGGDRKELGKHKMSRASLNGLIDNLESGIRKLEWNSKNTIWSGYYDDHSYSSESLSHKEQIVSEFLDRVNPKVVWDLGANTGRFSRIASRRGIQTISFDYDISCVEKNYLQCVKEGEKNILPLVLDLTNPSSGVGWENKERMSLFERGPADVILALALIHHLAIGNNLPFERIASFLWKISQHLIIEFVPKKDPQVQRLLRARKDIFQWYTQETFQSEFKTYFIIVEAVRIKGSERSLYLMERNPNAQVA